MDKKWHEQIYEEFKRQRPTMVKNVDSWEPGFDEFTIIVIYKDGSKDIYDSVLKTTKYIPSTYYDTEEPIYDFKRWKREFGTRLYRTICIKGMPQWRLAEICGVSEGTISRYINGVISPSAYMLYRLAKALNVSESYLTNFGEKIE